MAIKSEIIDGIEYKLFTNNQGPVVRVVDMDTGELFAEINYPDEQKAQDAYSIATAAAWQLAASRKPVLEEIS